MLGYNPMDLTEIERNALENFNAQIKGMSLGQLRELLAKHERWATKSWLRAKDKNPDSEVLTLAKCAALRHQIAQSDDMA